MKSVVPGLARQRMLRCSIISFAGIVATTSVGLADESATASDEATEAKPMPVSEASQPRPAAANVSHRNQFTLAMRLPLAFRWLTTYSSDDYCGSRSSDTATGNSPVCLGRAPFSIDLDIGYGAGNRVDAILETRIGIESDFAATGSGTGGPRLFHIAPGIRYYFAQGVRSKLFTTAQFVVDLTGYQDANSKSRGADFGVRSLSGLWFDFGRRASVFGFVGATLTGARWFRAEIEGGLGVAVRYP